VLRWPAEPAGHRDFRTWPEAWFGRRWHSRRWTRFLGTWPFPCLENAAKAHPAARSSGHHPQSSGAAQAASGRHPIRDSAPFRTGQGCSALSLLGCTAGGGSSHHHETPPRI